MYNFTYHRPSGLRQATNMLGKLEEAKILAGGQTLIPTMKLRLASPTNIIDLNGLGELAGIELKGGYALVTLQSALHFLNISRNLESDIVDQDVDEENVPIHSDRACPY